MPLTTNDALFEAWAEQIETVEQNLESLYGPPGITPTLPYITTENGLLEAIAEETGKGAWNFAKLYNATSVESSTDYTVTVPSTALYCGQLIMVGGNTERSDGALLSAGVTQITSKNEAGGEVDTFLVPEEVQALTGYGFSDGHAYNYIDFAQKNFVQNVDKLSFVGTETWSITGAGIFYTTISADDSQVTSNSSIGTTSVVCSDYPFVGGYGSGAQEDKTVTIGYNSSAGKINIAIKDNDYMKGTPSESRLAWIAHLAESPVVLHYPVVTPVVTDISTYLTDDIIKVEPGGTLTFVNENELDVPSEVEYIAI